MDYTTTTTSTADLASVAGLWAWFATFGVVALVFGLALYIFGALALMKIAQRTNTPNAWLAWIPIGNVYLITQIAKVPWWTMLAIFLAWIPFIGSIGLLALMIWWWWKVAENRNKPGWWGLMVTLVPVANLIFLGMLAWGKD